MPVTSPETIREQRLQRVRSVLASVRMEGLEPSAEAARLFQRYVEGELSFETLNDMFLEHLSSLHGPVPVSGNQRP